MNAVGIATLLHHSDPVLTAPNHPKPSIGRVVHYQSYGTPGGEYLPEPRAAIITAVDPKAPYGAVSLAVLNPTGMFFNPAVLFAEKPTPGSWNWPPRV